MIIPFESIIELMNRNNTPITGILHCGAYDGEEYEIYKKNGIENCLFVEPNPYLFDKLSRRVGLERCCEKAIFSHSGLNLPFFLAYSDDRTNLGCSSLLKLSKHLELYPCVKEIGKINVETITIDDLLKNKPDINLLVMDLQGIEYEALKGSINTIQQLSGILTEFSIEPLYEEACTLTDLDSFLWNPNIGFERTITQFARDCWGDAYYLRNSRPCSSNILRAGAS